MSFNSTGGNDGEDNDSLEVPTTSNASSFDRPAENPHPVTERSAEKSVEYHEL